MNEWWFSLSDASRVFWGISLAATLFQALIFAGSIVSGHEFDHATDTDGGNAAEGLKLLSIRAIVAFFVGFGWAGVLYLRNGGPVLIALAFAIVAGVVFMSVIFLVMRFLMSLRADGTMDYWNAVGQTGTVYVTIPPNHSGQGQVEVMIQGRLTTAHAVTEHSEPLSPQTPVIVQSVEGKTLLVVYPAY